MLKGAATIHGETGVRALFVLAVALAVLTTGCATSHSTVQVTQQNAGSTIELTVGSQLVVKLEANHTTGASWGLTEMDESILAKVSSSYEETAHPEGMVGCGGREVWTFNAIAPGTTKLRLEYRQWFGPKEKPWEAFEATVKVSK